jgi:ribosomal RNA-processing protein 7
MATKEAASSSSVPLLKGYLPVRLRLPPTWSKEYNDETYFYVREHQAGKKTGGDHPSSETTTTHGSSTSLAKPKCTLFVANAPVVPGVSTKILLQSLFGRFADIARVTVVPNPRRGHGDEDATGEDSPEGDAVSMKWTTKLQDPSFLPVIHSEGKYAHVVFENPKGMKKALRALHDAMKLNKGGQRPGLVLEPIEIQTLSDETNRIYREERRRLLNITENDDGDDFDDKESAAGQATGIRAVLARYRASAAELSRERIMEECNAVMQAYEEAEEEKKRTQQTAREQPDDDGFVTVSYSNAVGSQIELEATQHATGNDGHQRRKGNMRSRRKKEGVGSQELDDFYRFQRRDNKKRTIEDLRAQFDEDLKRVKQMKEERHYRPF